MARQYKDLIVDEADGALRVNLVNRDGSVVLRDVKVQISSRVLQDGDNFGALSANLLLELDSEGTPQIGGQLKQNYQTKADSALQTANKTVPGAINEINKTANEAMPKSGGTFQDEVNAPYKNSSNWTLRNTQIVDRAGGNQASQLLIFHRK